MIAFAPRKDFAHNGREMNSAVKRCGHKLLKKIALNIFFAGTLLSTGVLPATAGTVTPDLAPLAEAAEQKARSRTQTILARNALGSGLTSLAINFTEDVLAGSSISDDERDDALLTRASALIARGDFAEAEKSLRAVKKSSAAKTLREVWIKIGNSDFWNAGEIIKTIAPEALSTSDRVWLELAQAILAKQSGSADESVLRKNFEEVIKKGINPAQRSQFEYVQSWANATFVPEPSEEELTELREHAIRARGTREGAQLAKLLAITLNRKAHGNEGEEMRAAARKALADAGTVPPDLRPEFDFLEGIFQDSPSSVAARRAFMRVIRQRPDTALQEAAIAGLYRHVSKLVEEKKRDAAIIAVSEINAFFESAQTGNPALPSDGNKLAPDPRMLDLELFLRARISKLVNDTLRVEKAASELLEKCPTSALVPDTLRLLTIEAMSRREYRRAVPYLEKLRDAEPSEPEKAKINIILADCHFLSGDYDLANDVYSRTELKEYAGVIFSQRVLCEIRSDKFQAAEDLIEAYKNAPETFNRDWIFRAECNLIERLRKTGNLDKAAGQCTRFLEQENIPDAYRLRVLWAQAQLAIEQNIPEIAVSAADEISKILARQEKSETFLLPKTLETLKSDAILLKARALLRNGNLEEARKQLTRLREAFPDSNAAVISYLDEGRALAEKSFQFEALSCFERLIELCENNPKFSNYAPVAYTEAAQQEVSLGRPREAIDRLATLLRKHGNDRLKETIRMRQADLFRMLNDFESALAIYDQLYSLYKQAANVPEHVNLERIETARADCLLALASGIRKSDDAETRVALREAMRKAIAGYERICTSPEASIEICAEAGNKWGYATAEFIRLLENPSESAKFQANLDARKIYWNVINLVINRASKGGVDPSENWGVSTGYWLARSLFAIADLCEEAGDYAEARKAYEQVKNWSARGWMPGSEYARSREEAIRDK